jgi:hypothetical protein
MSNNIDLLSKANLKLLRLPAMSAEFSNRCSRASA